MAAARTFTTQLGISPIPETSDNAEFNRLIKLQNAILNLAMALDDRFGYTVYEQFERESLPPETTVNVQNLSASYYVCDEAMAAGAAVNLYNSGGTIRVRKASSVNNTRPCMGFTQEEIVAPGDIGKIQVGGGMVPYFIGLTPATFYYLSTAGGFITDSPPVSTGTTKQVIGFALSATSLMYVPNLSPIVNP